MKVTMKPTIDLNEVCKEMNLHNSDFEFTQMAENGSYITLDTSEYAIKDLMEEITWEEGKLVSRFNRLRNQLALVLKVREMGYTDSILVFVSW